MKIIFSLLLLFITFTSTAQFWKKEMQAPMITRSLGGSFQQFDGLNARIGNSPAFETVKDYTGTLGLGWLKEQERLISTGGIIAGSSMSGDRDEKSSTIRFLELNANIGYDLLKGKRQMLYPLAGLGVQGYQAIFYKDVSTVSFDDVLQSPVTQNNIRSVRFTNAFLVYRLGFGVSVSSSKHPSSSIGIQAGYTGSFKKQAWKSNENQALVNAPEDKISQYFVSLILTSKPGFMK